MMYRALVGRNYELTYLGSFPLPEMAEEAADCLAVHYAVGFNLDL